MWQSYMRYPLRDPVIRDIPVPPTIEARDNNGDTALIKATRVAYRTNVSHLVARGANTRVRDRQGRTPLMLAMSTETESVVISHQRDVGLCLLNAEMKRLDMRSLSTSEKQNLITVYSEFNNWEQTHHLPLTTWPTCIRAAAIEDGWTHSFLLQSTSILQSFLLQHIPQQQILRRPLDYGR
jgi:hypothetical protein